ncbi:WYL domain-containing protein [Alteromonas gracilis]
MSAKKSERLLNLLITLLVARQPVTKERLRQVIEGYRDSSDEAFEKMFERDKEELRALGIPVELEFLDRYFEDEQGYRIQREAFELPEVELAADEAAVVGLAARVWQHAGLAEATSQAVLKLRAGGVDVDRAALDIAQPAISVEEPAFDAVWAAVSARTPIRFDYRRTGATQVEERTLQPWGVLTSRGRWYVAGHDVDRAAPRLFRLSRIVGDVATAGPAGSFTVPADVDVRALATALAPPQPDREALIAVRSGQGHELRRRATTIGPDETEGWDLLRIAYADADALAADVLSQLDAAVVRGPDEVREAVTDRLRRLVTREAR